MNKNKLINHFIKILNSIDNQNQLLFLKSFFKCINSIKSQLTLNTDHSKINFNKSINSLEEYQKSELLFSICQKEESLFYSLEKDYLLSLSTLVINDSKKAINNFQPIIIDFISAYCLNPLDYSVNTQKFIDKSLFSFIKETTEKLNLTLITNHNKFINEDPEHKKLKQLLSDYDTDYEIKSTIIKPLLSKLNKPFKPE